MTAEDLQNLIEAVEHLFEALKEAAEPLFAKLKEAATLADKTCTQINEALEPQGKSQAVVRCTLISKEPMQWADFEAATAFRKLCSDLNIIPCLYYASNVRAYFCKLENAVVTPSWLAAHQCVDPLFYNLGGFQFYLGSRVDDIKAE